MPYTKHKNISPRNLKARSFYRGSLLRQDKKGRVERRRSEWTGIRTDLVWDCSAPNTRDITVPSSNHRWLDAHETASCNCEDFI